MISIRLPQLGGLTTGMDMFKSFVVGASLVVLGLALSNREVHAQSISDCYNAYNHCMDPGKGGVLTRAQALQCKENLDYCLSVAHPGVVANKQ